MNGDGTGIRGETVDEILWLDQSSDPEELGMSKLVDGVFKFYDKDGIFNPRTGGSGITESEHKVLRQLIHFIDEGPAEGFASGAYKEILPAADPFPTSVIWWTSAGKTNKIVEKTITYNANKTPSAIEWKMYDTGGSLLATVTDAISYFGVFELTRTRSIA